MPKIIREYGVYGYLDEIDEPENDSEYENDPDQEYDERRINDEE